MRYLLEKLLTLLIKGSIFIVKKLHALIWPLIQPYHTAHTKTLSSDGIRLSYHILLILVGFSSVLTIDILSITTLHPLILIISTILGSIAIIHSTYKHYVIPSGRWHRYVMWGSSTALVSIFMAIVHTSFMLFSRYSWIGVLCGHVYRYTLLFTAYHAIGNHRLSFTIQHAHISPHRTSLFVYTICSIAMLLTLLSTDNPTPPVDVHQLWSIIVRAFATTTLVPVYHYLTKSTNLLDHRMLAIVFYLSSLAITIINGATMIPLHTHGAMRFVITIIMSTYLLPLYCGSRFRPPTPTTHRPHYRWLNIAITIIRYTGSILYVLMT